MRPCHLKWLKKGNAIRRQLGGLAPKVVKQATLSHYVLYVYISSIFMIYVIFISANLMSLLIIAFISIESNGGPQKSYHQIMSLQPLLK